MPRIFFHEMGKQTIDDESSIPLIGFYEPLDPDIYRNFDKRN